MAAIASTDVTFTELSGAHALQGLGTRRQFTVEFGDAALTYPTGGVPLDKKKLGCPTLVHSLKVLGRTAVATTNPVFEWDGDQSDPKLLAFAVPDDSANDVTFVELDNTTAPDAQSLVVEVVGF